MAVKKSAGKKTVRKMAAKKPKLRIAKTHVRDRKTGKLRIKDPKRVKAGKKAAKTRGKWKHKPATKKKIGLGVKRAAKTGKNRFGRKVGKWGRPKLSKKR